MIETPIMLANDSEFKASEIIISICRELQCSFDIKYETLNEDSVLISDIIISKYGVHKIMLTSLYDVVASIRAVKNDMWREQNESYSPYIIDLYSEDFMESIKKSYLKLSRQARKCQK